ncbi:hypothetical protein IMCC3317_14840 [Kordia antarctica]|uniref:Type II toxin-antitoxin system RelE/ParE family toxin n=1 Tax=Kordia antarctica TaxID=1218801 RepID=A0A7L4ZHX9_9FLAO|nr:type II toxin-antitoxin system RelE/ParE family toxin [Kordia antarctica]QHI36130.1 hypothetical protein IMCC3317_14840 [Kordia antarctica]
MSTKKIRVVWSTKATTDLKDIFDWVKKQTTSVVLASNVVTDIVNSSKNIIFTEQYQVEELLGEPFRRIIVRHYKIIYKVESNTEIRILAIFDTHKNPNTIDIKIS